MAKTTIKAVSEVDLTALPGSGSDYTITAVGDVPTGGWKDPELVPRSGATHPGTASTTTISWPPNQVGSSLRSLRRSEPRTC